jgi:amidase
VGVAFRFYQEYTNAGIDYQPEPDLELAPRKDIHLPLKEDNADNAWAYRFDLHHSSPSSDLLEGKTFCVKDNVCVAGVPWLMGTDIFWPGSLHRVCEL